MGWWVDGIMGFPQRRHTIWRPGWEEWREGQAELEQM